MCRLSSTLHPNHTPYARTTSPTKSLQGTASIIGIFYLAFLVLMIASMWKIFTKAGEPGWAAICFRSSQRFYVFLKIAGKLGWWLILMLIPAS